LLNSPSDVDLRVAQVTALGNFFGWLVGLSVDWFVGWLVCRLVGRSVGWFVGWLVG